MNYFERHVLYEFNGKLVERQRVTLHQTSCNIDISRLYIYKFVHLQIHFQISFKFDRYDHNSLIIL